MSPNSEQAEKRALKKLQQLILQNSTIKQLSSPYIARYTHLTHRSIIVHLILIALGHSDEERGREVWN